MRDKISSDQQALFSRGTNIGHLARRLFPGGYDASQGVQQYSDAVNKTRQLMESGARIIYEAAFQYDHVLAICDILVKQDAHWHAYEVKSSTRISSAYLLDASLQYYVITHSGVALDDFFIVCINNQYVKNGTLDVNGLFQKIPVSSHVRQNTDFIKGRIDAAKTVLAYDKMPEVSIGEYCFSPYPCDFKGTCWKNIPPDSVFDLAGMTKSEQFSMYYSGILTCGDVPPSYSLNKAARVQVDCYNDNSTRIDRKEIYHFLNTLRYPLYFMDFEIFMPAVPIYQHSRPYQHIPFQYSLHLKETQKSEASHRGFLAEAGIDPRKLFLENLLKDTAGEGDILVYNATFELQVLQGLKADFPAYEAQINDRMQRIRDLMKPFQEKWYYHPQMKGSHSIKNVLPALVPELSYASLNIASGTMAMSAFEHLQSETDIFKIMEMREALLTYCKMDTYAMVRILEVLEKSVELNS